MLLRVYVAGVAVAAAIAGTIAGIAVPAAHSPSVGVLVLMTALLWLTEFLQVRQYHYRGHGVSHNLIEGVLAPVIYACSGAEVVLVCLCGLAAAEVLRRTGPMKAVFNVAQWTFAAAVGSLVFRAVVGSDPSSARAVAGVALATVSMSLVNQVTLAGVLSLAVRASGEQQSRADVLSGLVGRLISNGASLITGITLVAAYRWSPWLLVLGAVFVVGLDAAGRAHANVRADHSRLDALQRATHALATSLDAQSAIPTFLAEVRAGFEVRHVDLVFFGDSVDTVHRSHEAVENGYSVDEEAHQLADLLALTLSAPAYISTDSGASDAACYALAQAGHSRAIAVPLRRGTDTIGMLLLYDRLGVEGFESGEVSVATALGRELVGFLERVNLLREIDEERRKLTDILESTSDGIFTVDADGIVTSWNTGLIEMTGYSADEMVNTRHLGLLRTRDGTGRDVLIERWAEATGIAPLPAEIQIMTSGGGTVWLSCSYSRIPAAEGRSEILVVVARNITQQRELERLKDDFVAVVSHELRTPLVPIKGWAQTLINRGDRLSDHQRRTAVQSILAQAQKLESLVLNILEASRIESGRGDGEGVADVGAITMRLVEDTLSARPDRTVRVRPPSVPCQVRGSAVWVERAVANLLANAIKYSPDDAPVDVAITVEDNDVAVSVTDRGPGIASEAQERIFERFERLEETRTQTGTGLGLYITRRLARAMGGDVSVSSVPGAGSTFVLRLPVAPVTRLPEQRITEAGNVVSLR